ncbi:ROK family protein [Bifidobacterium xylocopae]|uniref:NagC family transcriptional regulator n=1 Tax=Bifidobacterium xylocopae TaxID=2493119 RepID=A0A366KEG4_9BIFI|nr:ROK family protein [Bifidobacterium xylocopae]RBP99598.1 NagC family transcriptional regulator [Bifidobacterium xylocopae]
MTNALQPDTASDSGVLARKHGLRLGIDIGGTKIEGVAIGPDGRTLAHWRTASRQGNEAVLEDVVRVARKLLGLVHQDRGIATVSLGIGIPGLVDSAHGQVKEAVNLSIRRMDLGPQARSALGMPVRVENDVNAAALGASRGLGLPSVAFINLGTGLGASIIRDGRIIHGASGCAGEIGHVPVEPHGFLCKCGQRGCLETVASGSAIQAHWPHATPPLPDMIAKARQGQADAQEALDLAIGGMATAVQIVGVSLDPDAIILGGGVTRTGPALLELVRSELARRGRASGFVKSQDLPDRISLAAPDRRIGAIGAALAGAVDDRDPSKRTQ